MIYDIEYETMPREAIEAIQRRRLQTTLERVYANVPFYRRKFIEAGLTPTDIKTLDDLKRIPLTPSRICATTIRLICSPSPWTWVYHSVP